MLDSNLRAYQQQGKILALSHEIFYSSAISSEVKGKSPLSHIFYLTCCAEARAFHMTFGSFLD